MINAKPEPRHGGWGGCLAMGEGTRMKERPGVGGLGNGGRVVRRENKKPHMK